MFLSYRDKKMRYFLLLLIIAIFSSSSLANVIIGGTRVIYLSDKREVSIAINNLDKENLFLIQSWIEDEDGNKVDDFIITPPLFKLLPEKENKIRIINSTNQLPNDRETVYWLNIKSIPALRKSDENRLNIILKSRLKLFYRPKEIITESTEIYKKIELKQLNKQLVVHNPTAFYINFNSIKIGNFKIETPGVLPPYSQKIWQIKPNKNNKIDWSFINDYGAIIETISLLNDNNNEQKK
ncbi:MAG TPA: molecular chaperone [Arsenophonus apicola]|uniref:fimbrial biogenesis chaperone n=1 Tax=Arsenophonus apicola TaxID=2879119 RepID=UPI001CDB930A|nr:molecular chaperone [Arsenophonus apicola]UBX27855.1 molecular chaperone [Arsenophonus apicola]